MASALDSIDEILASTRQLGENQVALANAWANSAINAAESYNLPDVDLPTLNWVAPVDPTLPPEDLTPVIMSMVDSGVSVYDQLVKDNFADFMDKYYPNYSVQDEYLREKLKGVVETGGKILPDYIENSLYQRARSRNAMESISQEQSAYADFASRGFSIPPGALLARVDAARKAAAVANAQVSAEIATKQQELAVENVRFALAELNKMRVDAIRDAVAYVGALVDSIRTKNSELSAIIQARQVFTDSYIKYYGVLYDKAKMQLTAGNYEATYLMQTDSVRIDAFVKSLSEQVRAAISGADAAARSAAAAIGSQNTMTNLSASEIISGATGG
jgi:hypothetical protein